MGMRRKIAARFSATRRSDEYKRQNTENELMTNWKKLFLFFLGLDQAFLGLDLMNRKNGDKILNKPESVKKTF